MDLTSVSTGVAKRKLKRRVGRGIGSGQGKTAGLGHKGQYASAGARLPSGLFEGGQMPLYRRFPKRGFSNATWHKNYAIVNVGDLEAFDANSTVDMAALKAKRLVVGTFDGVRILGDGDLTKKLDREGRPLLQDRRGEDQEGRRHLRTPPEAEEAGPQQDGVEEEGDQGRRSRQGSEDS